MINDVQRRRMGKFRADGTRIVLAIGGGMSVRRIESRRDRRGIPGMRDNDSCSLPLRIGVPDQQFHACLSFERQET